MSRHVAPLGVLQLGNRPSHFIGSLNNPDTFDFPIHCRQVPGAWVSNVVSGDPTMEPAFVATAQALVSEGAVAITTNCGFALRYQAAVAASVTVPVSTSSLLLLPYLTCAVGARVGVLTFDAGPLTSDLLRLAGVGPDALIAIAGIEGSATWEAMSRVENDFTVEGLVADLEIRIKTLRAEHPDVGALLFECAGFGAAAPELRQRTGLPIYDAVTNANLLMSGIRSARPNQRDTGRSTQQFVQTSSAVS